jgi:hypothetical protein
MQSAFGCVRLFTELSIIDHNFTLFVIVSTSAESLQAADNASARSRCND